MDPTTKKYVLLTGATGLLGQYLVRDLLAEGQRVAVVVRTGKLVNAQQRVENFMQRWEAEAGHDLPRPVVLEGDVCSEGLGLNGQAIDWVERHCDRVIHSAAVLTFHGASMDQDPWRTNLGGTKNVLALCKRTGIEQLHYMSTAYVCGKRSDRVYEADLAAGQEFRNDYEHCKYEAETLVRQADYIPSRTVYRPAVIVGDSQTGFTATYHGLFMYLRLMATLVPQQQRNAAGVIETPIRLPMSGEEPRNLVAVDWVSKVSCRLILNPQAHGKTFHITPDQCSTAKQLIDYCCDYFNSSGVEFLGKNAKRDPNSEFSERFFENASMYEDYETDDPDFDKTNLDEFAGDVPCPEIDREMVVRFIEFGTSNRWGKKREKPPVVACWFDRHADEISEAAKPLISDLPAGARLGLDVHGQGGGQWQLSRDTAGEISFELGLPTSDDAQVVVVNSTDVVAQTSDAEFQPDWSAIFSGAQADCVRA